MTVFRCFSFDPTRKTWENSNLSKASVEQKKLKTKIKKTFKSAQRELRKDAHFIGGERLKDQMDRYVLTNTSSCIAYVFMESHI